MTEQARDSHGRFAGGAEGAARNAGKIPITAHNGQQSVGTHLSAVRVGIINGKRQVYSISHAAKERQSILAGVDKRVGKRNVYHG